jgi:glutamyl-tRNA synthetase
MCSQDVGTPYNPAPPRGELRGRYAPSPTGGLHLGNARTALVAFWHARAQGGAFVMRVEDLDTKRSREAFVTTNLDELRWLGLTWDEGPDVGGPYEPYRQSERSGRYERALKTLQAAGRLFACYLSRKDLQELASAPHGAAPVYGPAQRAINKRLGPQKREAGKAPSLRFRAPPGRVAFTDLLAGPVTFDAEREVGDVVVRRADGEWAYQLAVVVDDLEMRITHVVRGDDLLPSTGAQLLLYRALGAPPPTFMHVPLLLEADGTRMAKRKGALTLSALRAAGVRPERVVGLLAYSLGLLTRPTEIAAEELIAGFNIRALHREAFRLEPTGLKWLYGGV